MIWKTDYNHVLLTTTSTSIIVSHRMVIIPPHRSLAIYLTTYVLKLASSSPHRPSKLHQPNQFFVHPRQRSLQVFRHKGGHVGIFTAQAGCSTCICMQRRLLTWRHTDLLSMPAQWELSQSLPLPLGCYSVHGRPWGGLTRRTRSVSSSFLALPSVCAEAGWLASP